MAPYLTLLLYH